MTVSYETAVYVEDVQLLTDEIVTLIRARTEHISAGHVRDAIIGASLITAAQELDDVGALEARRDHGHDPACRRQVDASRSLELGACAHKSGDVRYAPDRDAKTDIPGFSALGQLLTQHRNKWHLYSIPSSARAGREGEWE
jgi:hypothetical protein